MTIYLAPLVMLVGLVIFLAVKNNGDVKKIGWGMFFCGLFVSLLVFAHAGHVYRLP